jgi:predicted type IV restriction endonuclease
VKEHIIIAQNLYPGNADDALIAFLSDTSNSPSDRTNVAIWTMGQIRSKKALPILKELYKNDPKGKTCQDKHDSLLCQKELYYAIKCIENNEGFGLPLPDGT